MDVLIYLAISLLTFVIFIWYNRTTRSSLHQPPGPRPLPLVGNLFSINFSKMHLTFAELAEFYGKIFKVSILGLEIIVINDISLMRKALQGEEFHNVFSDRPDSFAAKYITFDSDIIVGKVDQGVFTLRAMLHKGFKVFGEGVARFENQVTGELDRLVSELHLHSKEDIDISPILKESFSNWMSSLITGRKAQPCDTEIIWDFNESVTRLGTLGISSLLTQMPILRFLPGKFSTSYRNCVKARDRLLQRFYESHAFRKETDGLLAVLVQMQMEKNQQAGYEIVSDLRGLILDIFLAGLDTTLKALINSFALLLKYPECKIKVSDEIDRVIGRARPPSLDDRQHMPYTKAFLMEVHRYVTEAPLAVPRVCSRDVTLEGYHIKKGALIFSNLWFIHHDEKLWHDPWNFRPERFLDSDGELLQADHDLRKAWVPFSLGRRVCPGETLAMTRTFLYLTRVLQEFDITPPASGCIPNVDPRCYPVSAILRVEEYLCKLVPRCTSD